LGEDFIHLSFVARKVWSANRLIVQRSVENVEENFMNLVDVVREGEGLLLSSPYSLLCWGNQPFFVCM
jgi:hypothetical protein